jgi:hypothetical protein
LIEIFPLRDVMISWLDPVCFHEHASTDAPNAIKGGDAVDVPPRIVTACECFHIGAICCLKQFLMEIRKRNKRNIRSIERVRKICASQIRNQKGETLFQPAPESIAEHQSKHLEEFKYRKNQVLNGQLSRRMAAN